MTKVFKLNVFNYIVFKHFLDLFMSLSGRFKNVFFFLLHTNVLRRELDAYKR